jgi:MFS family permease
MLGDGDAGASLTYAPREAYTPLMVTGVLAAVFVSAVFVPLIAAWFVSRHGRRRNYLLRVARRYNISPLFGVSRLTLLREAQKPHH